MTKNLDIDGIRKIAVNETALGIDTKPNRSEIIYYLRRDQYTVRDEGSRGYDLLVWNDDGYKMAVTVIADTDTTPSTTVVRGGGNL